MPDTPRSSLLAILGVLLIHSVAEVHGHCWDSGWCRDMDTEAEVMECLRACRLVLSDELPVYPGNGHMQPLSENIRKYVMSHFRWNKFGKSNNNGSDFGHKREDLSRDSSVEIFPVSSQAQDGWEGDTRGDQESVERQEGKRSYAMEHFRWGKPVGRKRRPIKVYPTEMEEESSENYPQEFRRDLSWESDYPELGSPEEKKNGKATTSDEEEHPEAAKKDSTEYQMHHFRWNAPASPKKKRYGGFMTSERSHTPLVTLFKNAIIKTAYKKGQ
ncbi:pro-opiomelanocortin [Elgaria multicarinata webbii]|uniref:pro-opiomelanocortin n=1 Tax=Elgaria multicarinata webbii TaxID=159646 RepID=UPI002FCD350F